MINKFISFRVGEKTLFQLEMLGMWKAIQKGIIGWDEACKIARIKVNKILSKN